MTADYSEAYVERWKEEKLFSYLERLLPDKGVRALAVDRLATSIRIAHELTPARWGLSKSPSRLRLNVGRLEAIALQRGLIAVMVHLPTLGRKSALALNARGDLQSPGGYASAPDSTYAVFGIEASTGLADSLEAIEEAHLKHLEVAASTGINGATPKSHHPGMVRLLGELSGKPIPQPTYVRVALEGSAPASDGSFSELEPNVVSTFDEGSVRDVVQSARERNSAARRACIAHFGTTCCVCEVSLEARYGPIARDLIHVHHLNPLATTSEQRSTDPIADLRPVCPNCHAVLHRRTPPLSIDEARKLVMKLVLPRE